MLKPVSEQFTSTFFSYVEKQPAGCWVWTGSLSNGYGQVASLKLTGKRGVMRAHRVSFYVRHGELPDCDLHHSCGNKACVNPDHLIPVSERDHMADMSPGSVGYQNKRKTHCPQGHEYTPDNTIPYSTNHQNWRRCRACWEARYGRPFMPRKRGLNG